MKKLLAIAALMGAAHLASAATTNIYLEDWGTGNTGVTGNGNINTVGWTGIAVSQSSGPFMGIFTATGASDAGSGAALDANTVYFTTLLPTQNTPGMFYTTSGASGAGANSTFADIDPTKFTNLSLTVEVRGAATDTNFFAIQEGGQWYVSTNQLAGSGNLGFPTFTNDVVAYTNIASAWKTLSMTTTNVTIGSTPGANLSGPITGIGIVELPTSAGFNYNQLAVTAFTPGAAPPTPATITSAPISQTVPQGGGAQFLVLTAGTPPLTFTWQANGVTLHDGNKYSGTTTNLLTISNAQPADAVSYTVIVSNAAPPAASNSSFSLTVNPVTPDVLYEETFPYIGPNGNLPITGVGWQGAFQGSTGIFANGTGLGAVFSFSGSPTTNIYYTSITNDTGFSGLPFDEIAPDSVPAVTLEASFTPGNGAALNPTNVVAFWAVEMEDGSWFSSAKSIPVETTTLNDFTLEQLAFTRAASNWNTVTINANSASIGGTPGAPLAGNIIGAGIVIVHLGLNGGGDFNFENFEITTNIATVLPPTIGSAGAPFSQTVASGGGVSFGVSATGAQPFTYGWTLNGVLLQDGGRISGAHTPTLTIANVTASDAGPIVAFVTNSVGVDRSDNYVSTDLAVTNPAVGLIYSETFPFVGPLSGNYPISSEGWVEAVPNQPNAVFETVGSDAAVFAFLGSAGTTAYYTDTASDTNQAGLPFPNVDLAAYSDLTFSADIAPQFASSNVTAFIAVQLSGTNWFVASSPLPVPTAADSSTFSTFTMPFNGAAANWKNLTVTSSGALIGSAATTNLTGVMTGAGLVFVTVGTGGTMNFDNFIITGTGVGGVIAGPRNGGTETLSWVGNPAVNLQSTTSLNAPVWQDVPGTLGANSATISLTGPSKFFRLVQH